MISTMAVSLLPSFAAGAISHFTRSESAPTNPNRRSLTTARGTSRLPVAASGRVEMTTAELAALLDGIDLNAARR